MAHSKSRANPNRHPRLDPNAVWEDRTALVRREVEAERIAVEAKTARLRALRLEKEAADKEVAGALESARPHRKRSLSIKV
jgi:hypothetical protein